MVAYNFRPRFAPKVEQLEKRQTIRGPRTRHARPGEPVQLYVDQRTRDCRKLVSPDPICVSVEPVTIGPSYVEVFWSRLPEDQLDQFAVADGFANAADMFDWFSKTHSLPFTGVLIKWKPQEP